MKYPLKSYLYHWGARLRVPLSFLQGMAHCVDAIQSPFEYFRFRNFGATAARNAPARGYIPRSDGYKLLEIGDLPGVQPLLDVGLRIAEERYESRKDYLGDSGQNPFSILMDRDEWKDNAELRKIAEDPTLLGIVADYFGTAPIVDDINVWVTTPNIDENGNYNSQKFHLDKPDVGYLSFFVLLKDLSDEEGPFTFYPADTSKRIIFGTNYASRYYLSDGRLSDEEATKIAPADQQIRLAGPVGSAGFVNTSACLHYGSRCATGKRVQAVIRFMPAIKASHDHKRSIHAAVPA